MSEYPSYCVYVQEPGANHLHKVYHDTEYGFPLHTDNELFGRLVLEINQAGLSWLTILKKKDAFFRAFDGFDIPVVANYTEADRERLLGDASIIRNRLKVNAAIHNANAIMELQAQHGSFAAWLKQNASRDLQQWTKLFKQHFKFVGGEIVKEFLMSTGHLPGAHEESCPIYHKILALNPVWASL